MALLTAPPLNPTPSPTTLKLHYTGQNLATSAGPPPAAVLDAAVVRRNCNRMLQAARRLRVGFRAHVKTHKTTEVTKLQVGGEGDVKVVCSTVSEVENLAPWLLECVREGREVNVLYGFPILLSAIPRLAAITRLLGEGRVGLFTDHPSHVKALDQVDDASWPGQIPVWVNIDVGDHREGVAPGSQQLADIAKAIAASRKVRLAGVYAHMSSSYASGSPEEALKYMSQELKGLEDGAISFLKSSGMTPAAAAGGDSKVTISLGATPTATSTQNLLEDTEGAREYRAMIEKIQQSFHVEVHAGVYPFMDMQQMATRARPQHSASDPSQSLLSYSEIGFRILVEVASLYPDRTEKPEALVSAGSIALGREPCKSYPGWATVTPWPAKSGDHYDPDGSKPGWIVGRISQEHGVLTWEGPRENMRQLEVGEKLMLWPNHACIAAANFGWFLVVDSDSDDPDRIVDVWVRWRGW